MTTLSRAHQGLQRHLREAARRHPRAGLRRSRTRASSTRSMHAEPAAGHAQGAGASTTRKARSMTDPADDDPDMPDALEVAAALDAQFAEDRQARRPAARRRAWRSRTSTTPFDMRTTAGADAFYANDRPPAGRDLRQAAARRRRDHPRRSRTWANTPPADPAAQLVRRHVVQRLRHRARPRRLQRRARASPWPRIS